MARSIGPGYISTVDMRTRAVFHVFFKPSGSSILCADVAVVADWATPATALTTRIAWVSWGLLPRNISDSVRMQAVSKVITLTARESGLEWTGNLVAASRVKTTELQTLFHIAQLSYGTEL